ncbi:MAG TPA: hypothetical protein DHV62_07100 [Elusimicrobia bacterium]|jgi:hypothetical protein|nr:hypothetical protein [Elusimicrobiota bacterium]
MCEQSIITNLKTVEDIAFTIGVDEFQLREISQNIPLHYKQIYIRTSPTKIRKISKPNEKLKAIQKLVNKRILQRIPLPDSVHSRKKRSILTNAEQHVGKEVIVSLDIKDFFPSISSLRVNQLFKKIGYNSEASAVLTRLTTLDGCLPQGAPTSPSIANLIITDMDKRFETLCAEQEFTYTRYTDDITISGDQYVRKFLPLFCKIVRQSGFLVNEKIKVEPRSRRQETTGIVVNVRPNIPKEKHRKISAIIHRCKTFGPSSVTNEDLSKFRERLLGHISYMSHINPTLGRRLLNDFNHIAW